MSNRAELAAVIIERDQALAQLAAIRAQIAVEGIVDFDGVAWIEHEPVYSILMQAPEAAAAYRRQLIEATANRAAEISEAAFLLHAIGVPGTGPFTIGQQHADEARVQIAKQIRKAFDIHTATPEVKP